MSAHDALGDQFKDHLRVFRGLNGVREPDEGVGLGSHWSYSPNVAYNFALNRNAWGEPFDEGDPFDEEDPGEVGTVIGAYVHPDHVVVPGTQEHEDWMHGEGVHHEDDMEDEATVRPGSPVHITDMSTVTYHDSTGEREEHTRLPTPITRKA